MTTKGKPRIGMALSGGGVRAGVFHLGLLARLARDELLEDVAFISTVSGGSMIIGLVYALSGNRWPSSHDYLTLALPEARRRLTNLSIERDYLLRLACQPWLLMQGRAKVLAASMQQLWGIDGMVKDLPAEPRWIINATTYETGKNWRFMPQRMGDYSFGYVIEPVIPIADAIAASAAFPGLIGPLVLRTDAFKWSQFDDLGLPSVPISPPMPTVHLWDGGVYDNLGVEALFKPRGDGLRNGLDFLIVSDASGGLRTARRARFQRVKRLVDIASDQVRSLRARMLFGHFASRPNTGVYLRMGQSAALVFREAGVMEGATQKVVEACLSDGDAALAGAEGTHLRRLSIEVFDRLCRHGWEVADCTLHVRTPDYFTHRAWVAANTSPSSW
jgi:NTE family protein